MTKRKTSSRLGLRQIPMMRKRALELKAQAAQARERSPKLFDKIDRIRRLSAQIVEPRYDMPSLRRDLMALMKGWKAKGVVNERLEALRVGYGIKTRNDAHSFLVLVKAAAEGLDRKKASKLTAELKRKFDNPVARQGASAARKRAEPVVVEKAAKSRGMNLENDW